MNRSALHTLTFLGLLSVTALASAGNSHHSGGNHSNHHNSSSNNSGNHGHHHSNFGWPSSGGYPWGSPYWVGNVGSNVQKHHGHHHNQPIPIDPGQGNGTSPVDPIPVTPPVVRDHRDDPSQTSGGFVFVNGHWERVRAPQYQTPIIVDPVVPVVRDHRTPKVPPLSTGNGQGGVTVTTTGNPGFGFGLPLPLLGNPQVRDHR